MPSLLVAVLRAPIPLPTPGKLTEKACTKCGAVLPVEAFSRETRNRHGNLGMPVIPLGAHAEWRSPHPR